MKILWLFIKKRHRADDVFLCIDQIRKNYFFAYEALIDNRCNLPVISHDDLFRDGGTFLRQEIIFPVLQPVDCVPIFQRS
jgi:hypothetical protein